MKTVTCTLLVTFIWHVTANVDLLTARQAHESIESTLLNETHLLSLIHADDLNEAPIDIPRYSRLQCILDMLFVIKSATAKNKWALESEYHH